MHAWPIAAENAAKHGVERIRFLHGDLFGPLESGEQFGFIISNPPYIADEAIATLEIGVRQYEPHDALKGGPGGFVVFDRLITGAVPRLSPGGHLIIEIGSPQEAPARAKLAAIPEYTVAATIFDFSGHPRVLRAQKK